MMCTVCSPSQYWINWQHWHLFSIIRHRKIAQSNCTTMGKALVHSLSRAFLHYQSVGLFLLEILNMEVVFQPARLNRATNCARLLPAGLSTQRLSWRIKHPQAVSPKATERSTSLPRSATLLAYRHNSVFGGMGREPKKTPPSVPCFGGHCFAATRSALVYLTKESK